MSDFFSTFVGVKKTRNKTLHDMTKVQIKSDKYTPFGGIFYVIDKFNQILSSEITRSLGSRVKSFGYSYADIVRALFCVYFCGGDAVEDLKEANLIDMLSECPGVKIPSPDTVLRGISELATDNIIYTSKKGNEYAFNPATKLNRLMIQSLVATGQLVPGNEYDFDFDHQYVETEKCDAVRTYKGFDGYGPGVSTIGNLTVGIENRDGSANVKFHQEDTLKRTFENLNSFSINVNRARMDCGSYTKEVIRTVMAHSKTFYIRAERCASLHESLIRHKDGWTKAEINFENYEIRTMPFDQFEEDEFLHLRLVVQRQPKKSETKDIFGDDFQYRCILTNDWDMTDEEVILYYNQRGAQERILDDQNNGFGWKHLPKSFMNENAVFMILTAMARNFYLYLLDNPVLQKDFGISKTARIKKFIFRFITVPAKWINTARQNVLKIFSEKPYDKVWAMAYT